MRVTREAQEKTRAALVEAAERCFSDRGFDRTTTREVARGAGVAAGTLFNYFPSKEALGIAILARADGEAQEEFRATRRVGESLEEALFALVAIQLRHLAPYRGWVGEVLDAGWSPLRAGDSDQAGALRRGLLERVGALRGEHGVAAEETLLDQHLFWTLYLGTLAFWARDDTEHQEATLALLDRSTRLYCASLREDAADSSKE